jgi:hypothetical protein
MVHRDSFINKIRALGYSYKAQQKRTYLYRKVGGTHYISVPMRDLIADDVVRSALFQAGCQSVEVDAFIASAKS